MTRAVVTGATGFIGKFLVRELLENDYEVFAIVKDKKKLEPFWGYIYEKNLRLHIIELNLENIKELEKYITKECQVFYHLAWEGMVGEELLDCRIQLKNVEYMLSTIEVASGIGCKRYVGSGSGSQFELFAQNGRKAVGDKHKYFKYAKQVCQDVGEEFSYDRGMDFFWPISINPYGPTETKPRLINTVIDNLLKGESQKLSTGNQLYDFLYIEDEVRALRLIGERGIPNHQYILSSGNAKQLKEYIIELRDLVNPEGKLLFGEMKFNGVYLPEQCFDNGVLVKDTGFVPKISFEEGIKRTVDYIKGGR